MAEQKKFSELLTRLLENSKEGNRCWAKVHRMRDDDPYRENYARNGQDKDKAIINIRSLLLSGKYIAESESEELAIVEKIRKKVESYHWELDFDPININIAKEKRELLKHLELLKEQIESGERVDIEKAGQEELEREREKENEEKLDKFRTFDDECMNDIFFIGMNLEGNTSEINDYRKIKNLQKRLKSWPNNQRDEYIEGRKKDLEKTLQDLENKVPERIKLKSRNNPNKCSHSNIYWKKDEVAYCLDCGEDENNKFLHKLGVFHKKSLDVWTSKHKLEDWNTLELTNKLLGTFTTQDQLKQTYQQVVQELNQLAKSKGINDPIETPNDRERERERERAN